MCAWEPGLLNDRWWFEKRFFHWAEQRVQKISNINARACSPSLKHKSKKEERAQSKFPLWNQRNVNRPRTLSKCFFKGRETKYTFGKRRPHNTAVCWDRPSSLLHPTTRCPPKSPMGCRKNSAVCWEKWQPSTFSFVLNILTAKSCSYEQNSAVIIQPRRRVLTRDKAQGKAGVAE